MYCVAQLPTEMLKSQLSNGLILMVLGMAIVFVFLTILVFTTLTVSKIVKKFESKAPKAALAAPAPVVAPAVSSNDAEVAIAIAAAMAKKN